MAKQTVGIGAAANDGNGDGARVAFGKINDNFNEVYTALGDGSSLAVPETIQDLVGGMVTGNTETRITVTYQDADGTLDFVVDNDLSNYDNSSSGFAVAATLASASNGEGASLIGLENTGGFFGSATDVEAALASAGNSLGDLEPWATISPSSKLETDDITDRVKAFDASGSSSATRPSGFDVVYWYNHGGVKPDNATSADIYSIAGSEVIQIVCSPAGDDLTTGTGKVTFRMPFAMTLTDVRASVATAPTGAALTVDINEGGSTILSTKLTIDASEKTSTTAATAAVISDSALADDAEITIDIDQVGSTIAGTDLIVTLYGDRA